MLFIHWRQIITHKHKKEGQTYIGMDQVLHRFIPTGRSYILSSLVSYSNIWADRSYVFEAYSSTVYYIWGWKFCSDALESHWMVERWSVTPTRKWFAVIIFIRLRSSLIYGVISWLYASSFLTQPKWPSFHHYTCNTGAGLVIVTGPVHQVIQPKIHAHFHTIDLKWGQSQPISLFFIGCSEARWAEQRFF